MSKLYLRLATTNIKNSKQLYIPYLITSMISVLMFYSIVAMENNRGIGNIPGADNLKIILGFGIYIVAFFICIFLFYTNSFIIKKRKRELGVYNVLGMEKRHIARLLSVECFINFVVTVGVGLVLAIAFNKLLTMILFKIMGVDVSISFYISKTGILATLLLFCAINIATLMYNIVQVRLANPMELLRGSKTGEKEPKTKIVLTLIGIISLGTGYYISITTANPVAALQMFFIAVILVIVGTYCLFTAGSIAFLKLLRKNKKFYYQTNHFTAVSGMLYRMKQNAVGLANICILSTMVLVCLSTTVSMYLGIEDELQARYPNSVAVSMENTDQQGATEVMDVMVDIAKENGRKISGQSMYHSFDVVGRQDASGFDVHGEKVTNLNAKNVCDLSFMLKDDYEKMNHVELEEIPKGEALILGNKEYDRDTLDILGTSIPVLQSKEKINLSLMDEYMASVLDGMYYVLMPNEEELQSIYKKSIEDLGDNYSPMSYKMAFDLDGTAKEKITCENKIEEKLAQGYPLKIETRDTQAKDFKATYGGFFFLGLFFGVMFLMITVLIIFYKQISEGYDDKERFEIMQKVGMSNKEVKKTIRSQIVMVFILPIATASLHTVMAYPIIEKLLKMLNLTNVTLFKWCLLGTIIGFFLIYVLVYLLTSKNYYKIVGNQINA